MEKGKKGCKRLDKRNMVSIKKEGLAFGRRMPASFAGRLQKSLKRNQSRGK